jgi:hypothetical protein
LSTTWMSTIERGSKSFIWCVLHQFPNHVTQIVWAAWSSRWWGLLLETNLEPVLHRLARWYILMPKKYKFGYILESLRS